jgi:hypothetical protein
MRIKVLRAFLLRGEVQPVGSEIEVSDAFGREICFGNKAERVSGAPLAQPGPMNLDTAGALAPQVATASKPTKGKAK